MSLINVREKTIQAKIVYYGTGLSGKTTSLKHVHRVIDPDRRVELVSLNTEGDRTFFFDFLPIPLGSVNGYQVKIQAFTVPGQVKYNLTRRYVLRGADAVIFVADSTAVAFDDNVRSAVGLVENLVANGLDPEKTPVILQYNKRDAPTAVPVERLRSTLNPRGLDEFETVATTGEGVFEAFTTVCGLVTERLAREYRVGNPESARTSVLRRLRGAQAAWTASRDRPAAGADEPAAAEGLASLAEPSAPAVVEVSSKEDPDVPDAANLLQRAVEANIESARLVADLTETRRRLADHVRQLAALHQTGVTLSSELDTDCLLDRVLASALRTVGTEQGSVLLTCDGGTSVRPKVVHGLSEDLLVPDGAPDPVAMERILQRRPFVLELETHSGPADAAEDVQPLVALVAPLVHQSEVLGAIAAYVTDRPVDVDLRQRLRFLDAVASQAAVALVNAQLYARIESFNRELERKVEDRTRELAGALEELRVIDRLKDDFLASMSHELLTPLQSIESAAEILASVTDDEGESARSDRREFTAVVRREAVRLTAMLRTVLDLSQLEAGEVRLRHEPVLLRDAVADSLGRLGEAMQAAEVRVDLDADASLPPASADPHGLGRVLDALLANAVKFGPRGGTVRISVRRADDEIRVEVRDHGPGVPESRRAAIFEKFKQTGDVLTEKPAGLGLGLPTARLLVERMGGRIWHAPAEGGGSLFGFTVPVASPVLA